MAILEISLSRRTQSLITLTVQNASIALVTRASRLGHPDDLYLPSVAVFGAEVSSRPMARNGQMIYVSYRSSKLPSVS